MSSYKSIYEALKDLYPGRLNDVKYFVTERGASVDGALEEVVGRDPRVPAHVKELEAIVEYLISEGANVNRKLPDGDLPIHLAAGPGSVGVLKILISNGADVNAMDSSGLLTPLDRAEISSFDSGEKMRLLRAAGAQLGSERRRSGASSSGSGGSSGCLVFFAALGTLLTSGICGLALLAATVWNF